MKYNILILLVLVSFSCEKDKDESESHWVDCDYSTGYNTSIQGFNSMPIEEQLRNRLGGDFHLRFRQSPILTQKSRVFVEVQEIQQGAIEGKVYKTAEAVFAKMSSKSDDMQWHDDQVFTEPMEDCRYVSSGYGLRSVPMPRPEPDTVGPAPIQKDFYDLSHKLDDRVLTLTFGVALEDVSSEYMFSLWVDVDGNGRRNVGDFISEEGTRMFYNPHVPVLENHLLVGIDHNEKDEVDRIHKINIVTDWQEGLLPPGERDYELILQLVSTAEQSVTLTVSESLAYIESQEGVFDFEVKDSDVEGQSWMIEAWLDIDGDGELTKGDIWTSKEEVLGAITEGFELQLTFDEVYE